MDCSGCQYYFHERDTNFKGCQCEDNEAVDEWQGETNPEEPCPGYVEKMTKSEYKASLEW